jgi:threonine dehydrogenase-like Zn-dependent dehydrogenase
MTDLVRAAVQTGPNQMEVRQFPRPKIGPDEGIVRLERCGICGSDVEMFRGERQRPACIPGHELLGIIDEVGERAAQRWAVTAGDRVAVEIVVPCHNCDLCLMGRYMSCRNKPGGYGGSTPIEREPPLWGGYAEYLYLHPNAIVHKVEKDLDPDIAVMFNPLGAGVRWTLHLGEAKLGDTVLILGPGQRGLMSVIAAKMAGAGTIIVTGLEKDAHKLALAQEFGADHVINVDKENTVARVMEITDGAGADVVLDVTPMAHQPVLDAIDGVRHGGRVVLAGLKGRRPMSFVSDSIIQKGATVVGAYSVDARAYVDAIKIIESRRFPFEKLHTHTFGLEDAAHAIDVLAGDVPGEQAIHVSIDPHR